MDTTKNYINAILKDLNTYNQNFGLFCLNAGFYDIKDLKTKKTLYTGKLDDIKQFIENYRDLYIDPDKRNLYRSLINTYNLYNN